eukprot:scaffold7247_cov189-Skeletonema_dohrnii-CCMP3373.AAC.1
MSVEQNRVSRQARDMEDLMATAVVMITTLTAVVESTMRAFQNATHRLPTTTTSQDRKDWVNLEGMANACD